MRLGARRRAVGKHAGERVSRRRRPPQIAPQVSRPPYGDPDAPPFPTVVADPVAEVAPEPVQVEIPVAAAPPPPTPPAPVPQVYPEPAFAPKPERLSRRTRRRLRREAKRAEKSRRAHEKALGLDLPVPVAPAPEPASVREQAPGPDSGPRPEPARAPSAVAVATPVEVEPELGPDLESDADLTRQERRRIRRERRAAHQVELAERAKAARAAHAAAIADVPLRPPTAGNGLPAVFKKRYLLKLLVKREISARYQASFLGLLWSYIGPTCQFFVYWFVMGEILGLHDQVENFGVHIFSGLVVVHFFTETFGAGTRSIVGNKSIVMKLPMPREMFPVASMLVSLFHVFPQLVVLVVACLAYGWVPDAVGIAAFFLSMFIAMLLGTGGALIFSAANVYFRDFGKLVSIIQLFIRFSVPMIYPYTMVDDRFGEGAKYYLFNPLADCVLLVQRAFWVGTTKDPEGSAVTELPPDLFVWGFAMVGVGIVVLVIGQVVFSKLENRIPERL